MRNFRHFLAVDEDTDRLLLVSSTLHRKFPNAIVQTGRESDAAVEAARLQQFDAIVVCRSTDMDEIPLIEYLRTVTSAPIISLCGPFISERALRAGATRCLSHEQWLLVGTTVAEAIGAEWTR